MLSKMVDFLKFGIEKNFIINAVRIFLIYTSDIHRSLMLAWLNKIEYTDIHIFRNVNY